MIKFLHAGTAESSKRLVGLSLTAAMIVEMFISHSEVLYYCNAGLAASALGFTAIEKVLTKKDIINDNNSTSN